MADRNDTEYLLGEQAPQRPSSASARITQSVLDVMPVNVDSSATIAIGRVENDPLRLATATCWSTPANSSGERVTVEFHGFCTEDILTWTVGTESNARPGAHRTWKNRMPLPMSKEMSLLIARTAAYCSVYMEWLGDRSHDASHLGRVLRYADMICAKRGSALTAYELFLVVMAILTHDIGDHKWKTEETREQMVRKLIGTDLCTKEDVDKIIRAGDRVSWTAEMRDGVPPDMTEVEKIVHDVDRIDASGAVGISRAFYFSATRGQRMYAPTHYICDNENHSSALCHFWDKLLLLPDHMLTPEGAEMIKPHHALLVKFYMEYVKQANVTTFYPHPNSPHSPVQLMYDDNWDRAHQVDTDEASMTGKESFGMPKIFSGFVNDYW